MENIDAKRLMELMETDQECLIRELNIVRAGVATEWGRHAIDVAIEKIKNSDQAKPKYDRSYRAFCDDWDNSTGKMLNHDW